jgi:glycosyltransferase involved in cell wall biosynthesis
MTRVVVLPSDETGCGHYRMAWPADVVQQVRPDWSVEVYRPNDVMFGTGADGSLWQVRGIPEPDKIDLLVVQRVATRAQYEFVVWASKHAAIVMDADDALWTIDPDNVAHEGWNSDRVHWRWLDSASRHADMVTVTTDALAQRYGAHGRVEVLPNCVPGSLEESLVSVRDTLDQTPTLGWAGVTVTHPHDLKVVGTAVRDVVTDTGALVRAVGDGPGVSREWGVPAEHVAPQTLGLPYYTALTTLDVGLVPLADTKFNKAKSYLKALEYAAAGVVPVVSNTPAHRALRKSLHLLVATSPRQWHDELEWLVEHPDARQEMADQNMRQVFNRHTYEMHAECWATAWERALNRKAKMR